jgi:hypothetical protein
MSYGTITVFSDPETGKRYTITCNGDDSCFSETLDGQTISRFTFKTEQLPVLKRLFAKAWQSGKDSMTKEKSEHGQS